jgi:hypothetical protein
VNVEAGEGLRHRLGCPFRLWVLFGIGSQGVALG